MIKPGLRRAGMDRIEGIERIEGSFYNVMDFHTRFLVFSKR